MTPRLLKFMCVLLAGILGAMAGYLYAAMLPRSPFEVVAWIVVGGIGGMATGAGFAALYQPSRRPPDLRSDDGEP